ncbi:hypothetical protein ACE05C_20785, partial [Marinobacter shengliensis]
LLYRPRLCYCRLWIQFQPVELTDSGKNEEMQRLHREMTRNAMSEGGFEARVQMMTEEGRAYHKALKQRQKNTAG